MKVIKKKSFLIHRTYHGGVLETGRDSGDGRGKVRVEKERAVGRGEEGDEKKEDR